MRTADTDPVLGPHVVLIGSSLAQLDTFAARDYTDSGGQPVASTRRYAWGDGAEQQDDQTRIAKSKSKNYRGLSVPVPEENLRREGA